MAAPVRYLSGRQQQQKIGIEGNTDNQKVLEVVGRVGIGTTIFEPDSELEVRGDVNISGQLTVGGNTFGVDTETRNLNVSGISTFTGAIDANGSLDVDGHTELDDVNVSGASTFTGSADFNGDIDVDGHTELDNLRVSGVSTFIGAIDADGSLDVDGHTELDDVNVSGVSTLTGNVSFGSSAFFGDNDKINMGDNDDLQIFHHTNGTGVIQNAGSGQLQIRSDEIRLLNQATDENYAFFRDDGAVELYYDNVKRFETSGIGITVTGQLDSTTLNVSGVSTLTGNVSFGSSALFGDGDTILMGDGDDLQIFHSGVTGNIKNTTGTLILQSSTVRIQDSGSSETAFSASDGVTQLYYKNSKKFETNGVGVTVYNQLDATDLNISGVSTFTGAADFNGDIDVDGHTELDDVNVSGASTFTGAIDANGSLDVDGHTELDDVNVSGASTFTGAIDANGDLDVDGHTELDNLNVSGVSTFVGVATFSTNDVYVAQRLFVGGVEVGGDTNTFAGINTFTDTTDNTLGDSNTGAVQINGGLGVDKNVSVGAGLSVGEGITVAGLSTFVGLVTITNGDVHISQRLFVGGLEVEGGAGENIFSGISTFTNQTNNVLGNSDTGATHFNGGIGIDKNATVGAGLSVVAGFEVGGVSTFTGAIDANGGANIAGGLVANSAQISDLTDNRVVIAGSSGELEDDSNLTFNGTQLAVGVDLDVDGHTELDNVNASGISSATAFANFDYLQAPFGSTVSFTVTVASKDASHRYNGTGSGSAYLINGVQSPFLTLTPGRTYRFNLSASDQSNHPFRFYLEADKTTQYTTNVTTSATYTEITIGDETPVVLHYQCSAHEYMGNAVQTNSNVINTNYNAILRGGLDVDGHTELDDVNVSGASTFASAIDANNGLDVSGAILNVTSGLVANSAKVSDLTDNRVVIAGASGELEDTSKLTFDGSTLAIVGDATFTGNVSIAGTLTKEDVTDVDSIGLVTARTGVRINSGGLVVTSGVSTFTDNIIGNLTGNATTATNLAGGDTGDIPYQSSNGTTTFVDATGAGNGQVLLWGGSAPIWSSVSAASGNFGGITLQEEGSTVGTASSVTGINFIGNNVTAAAGSGHVVGSVTISDTPTFDSLKVTGISTIPSVTGPTTFSGGDVNVGTAITFDPVSGIVSATAFYGSGENLTDVLNQKIEGLQVFDEGNNIGTGYTFSAIDVVGSNISVAAVGLGTTARITLSDTPTFDTVEVTNNITANGNIVGDNSTNITGINQVTATTFSGALSGNATSATTATNVTVTANNNTDENVLLTFVDGATGSQGLESDTNLFYNPNSNTLYAGTFSGNFVGGTVSGTTGSFSSDVDIVDKIVHTGDANTAIRFPAADTFTVETSGNERIRVSAAGTVSIGSAGRTDWDNSTNVGCQFQIEGLSQPTSRMSITRNSNDAFDGGIILGKSRGTSDGSATIVQDGDGLGFISFQGTDGTTMLEGAKIDAIVRHSVASDDMPTDLVFYTNNDTTTTAERLRITSAGDVGIGLTNPSAKLHTIGDVMIQGTGGTGEQSLFIGKSATYTPSARGVAVAADQNSSADHDMVLKTSTGSSGLVEQVRIDSSGNVGVGTDNPGVKLDVRGTARFTDYVYGQVSTGILYINDDVALSATKKLYFDTGSNTYIHEQSSDNLAIVTGGSERIRATSTGEILIGDDALVENNHYGDNATVQVSDDTSAVIDAITYSSSFRGAIELMRARGTQASPADVVDTNPLGDVNFFGYNSSGSTGDKFMLAAQVGAIVDGTPGSGDQTMPGALIFKTATASTGQPSERLRISSSGNVGINQTNPSEKLDVNGNVKAVDFNTTSDENLKNNIQTIENPLAKVSEIRGVNFDWKETQKPSMGVIAQEVEKVLPELVTDSGTKTVNYNGLVGLLIEVVKEQQTQINSLNERLSQLE